MLLPLLQNETFRSRGMVFIIEKKNTLKIQFTTLITQTKFFFLKKKIT